MGEVIIAACGGAAVAGMFSLITWLLNRKAQKKDREADAHSSTSAGVQVLLRVRIKQIAKQYLELDRIDAETLEDLVQMYDAYKGLGGNGYLDALMKAVKGLKMTKGD